LAAIALVAAMILLHRSSTTIEITAGTAAMPSLPELHAIARIHELPLQETDDQSSVNTAQAKH
jgi:hypothetical protein